MKAPEEFDKMLGELQVEEELFRSKVHVGAAKSRLRQRFETAERNSTIRWGLFSLSPVPTAALGLCVMALTITFAFRTSIQKSQSSKAEEVLESLLAEHQISIFDEDVLSLQELS